jgi:hypothetical protein
MRGLYLIAGRKKLMSQFVWNKPVETLALPEPVGFADVQLREPGAVLKGLHHTLLV